MQATPLHDSGRGVFRMGDEDGIARSGSFGSSASSSDFGDFTIGGPLWMEDPSHVKRRSMRQSTGGAEQWGGRAPSEALALFNEAKSAEKGFKALVAAGFISEATPEELAQFILANDGKLELSRVGDYVGGDSETEKEVLRLLLETFDFKGVPLDSAMRKMIALIKLPGESQKIDRILTLLGEHYVSCNPTGELALDHADTACIIAFSLVMLNVDAHNDNITASKKMTQRQYINNLRGICKDRSDPDEAMLRGFYARVTHYEWAVEERAHARIVHEGWVFKASSQQVSANELAAHHPPPPSLASHHPPPRCTTSRLSPLAPAASRFTTARACCCAVGGWSHAHAYAHAHAHAHARAHAHAHEHARARASRGSVGGWPHAQALRGALLPRDLLFPRASRSRPRCVCPARGAGRTPRGQGPCVLV